MEFLVTMPCRLLIEVDLQNVQYNSTKPYSKYTGVGYTYTAQAVNCYKTISYTQEKGNMFFLTASDPQYMFLLDFSLIHLVPSGLHNT